ncbi:MAG: nitroreductase family protein [Treponema sp.]|nr:nitroreductase family protein [Treponema sp.]
MGNPFFDALIERRSVYAIGDKEVAPIDKVMEVIEISVKHTPTAFNSQSGRIALLKGASHAKAWDMTEAALRRLVPAEQFEATEKKIRSFKAGYATVLFYEDTDIVKGLQEKFPLYKDNFPIWAHQANGMMQLAVWTGLQQLGYGASLQHYGEVVEAEWRAEFGIPPAWKLVGQMPFGNIVAMPEAKSFAPLDGRIKTLG